MAATKYEYFTGTDDSQYGPQSIYWYGQTFTIGAVGTDVSQIAYSVKLKLAKVNSPTGNLTAAIRATTSDLPTGSNLCSGTKDVATLTTTPTWYEITLGTGTLLLPATKYAIVVYCPTADGANAPLWRQVTAGGYTGGSTVNSSNSGSTWSASPTQDMVFEIWSNSEGPSPSGSIFPFQAVTRVTNIIHRYNRAKQVYTMEANLGDVISDFGIPEWAEEPQLAITPKADEPVTAGEVDKIVKDATPPGIPPGKPRWEATQPDLPPVITDEKREPWYKPYVPTWQKITPWKEEKGETLLGVVFDFFKGLFK